MNEEALNFLAFWEACKWIRHNLPAKFPEEDYTEWVTLVAGGEERDPEGLEIMRYFQTKVAKEYLKKYNKPK